MIKFWKFNKEPKPASEAPLALQTPKTATGTAMETTDTPKPPKEAIVSKPMKREPNHSLVCANCGKPFLANRSDAKYCSNRCRQDAFRTGRNPYYYRQPAEYFLKKFLRIFLSELMGKAGRVLDVIEIIHLIDKLNIGVALFQKHLEDTNYYKRFALGELHHQLSFTLGYIRKERLKESPLQIDARTWQQFGQVYQTLLDEEGFV